MSNYHGDSVPRKPVAPISLSSQALPERHDSKEDCERPTVRTTAVSPDEQTLKEYSHVAVSAVQKIDKKRTSFNDGLENPVGVPLLQPSPTLYDRQDKIPGHLDHGEARPRVRRWQLGHWKLEILSCLFSVALLIALVVLLRTRHDKPLPDWPLGFTLNTATALISTFARAAMVIPISEGLSQLKWNWLVRGRPVMDLALFDQASRGLWGSLKMVCAGRGQVYGIVAAAVLLSSLATSTLTQSAIIFREKQINATELLGSHEATALAVTAYPPMFGVDNDWSKSIDESGFEEDLTPEDAREVYNMYNEQAWALFSSFLSGLSLVHGSRMVQPLDGNVCTTADCAWTRFSTIGICAEVRNVTDSLAVQDVKQDGSFTAKLEPFPHAYLQMPSPSRARSGHFNVSTPSILGLDGEPLFTPGRIHTGARVPWAWPPQWSSPGFEYGPDTDILNTTQAQVVFLYTNRESSNYQESVRAAEMMLHFCTQTYDVSVSEGVSRTKLISNSTNIHMVNYTVTGEMGFLELEDEEGGTPRRLMWPYPDHSLTAWTDRGDEVSGIVLMALLQGAVQEDAGADGFAIIPQTESDIDRIIYENIERMGKNIGMTMTNALREYGDRVRGTPYQTVTYIIVQWEWLSLIGAQVVLTIVFLVLVIGHTAILGVDVVKSSSIATLTSVPRWKPASEETRLENIEMDGLQTSLDKNLVGTLRQRNGHWVLELSHRTDEVKV